MTRASTLLFLAGILGGCSALVSPDESDLDPEASDAGGSDAGRTDGFVPPRDGGPDDDGGPMPDTGFTCAGGCDDGIACTTDTCVAADTCDRVPNDALCDDDERCNPGSGCVPRMCENDGDCNDGRPCNGDETCNPGGDGADPATGCVAGSPPACDDGFVCTTDTCVNDAGGCVSTPDHSACADGIDCSVDSCNPALATEPSGCLNVEDDALCDTGFCITGGTCSIDAGGCEGGAMRDCRDGDPCTADSCDATTMMCVRVLRDEDMDGYPAASVSGSTCAGGTDCDDLDASQNPGATEFCNGRDDDCDGMTDEGCTSIPDDCSDAEALTLDASGNATRTGSFAIYTANYGTQCGASGGRDAVYYVDIDSLSDVTISTVGSAADTVLAVGLDCSTDGFFGLGCDDDIDTGVDRASRIWVHRIGPRTGMASTRLYILVDSYNSSVTGDWTLSVNVSPARADTCATPLDITGGGSMIGFIGLGTPVVSQRGSCQSVVDTSSEAIAAFSGSPGGMFRFIALSQSFDPDLYVRSAPCGTGTELDCVAGDGGGMFGWRYVTEYQDVVTPGSSYYVFLDGASSSGSYWLSYEP